ATVTFQNYFRMYKKLAGMTGTADTEAAEFSKIYNLDVTIIPTNMPMVRQDMNDVVYRTEQEKWRNAAQEIADRATTGQPVLVGTISVEKSEKLAAILKKNGVRHEILNAKNHEREAYIVAQAGRYGAVTVSTNMAGRGTDILLGGNPEFLAQEEVLKQKLVESLVGEAPVVPDRDFYYFQRGDMGYRTPAARYQEIYSKFKTQCQDEHAKVVAAGGLCIVGTERHESRRIDNQLRGRAGRQGDPGASRFFLSLQDDLLRIFGGDRIQGLMLRLGMEEDVPIESRLITKRIAAAQKAVEAQNFASRKHVKEYDDVMDKQRKAVYGLRRQLLEGADMKEKIFEIVDGILATFIDARCPEGADPYKWDLTGLQTDINSQFGLRFNPADVASMTRDQMEESILDRLRLRYDEKESSVGPEIMRETERMIWLSVIDQQWKDHLLSMDHLKEGIGMRAYGQKDPLIEYKKEGFQIFQEMMDRIEDEMVRFLFFLQPVPAGANPRRQLEAEPVPDPERDHSARKSFVDLTRNIQRKKEREMEMLQFTGGETSSQPAAQVIKGDKVGRNDPCPCGSGKKYKKCHGT
ncbi:MAG: SEC-C domain-containing protein, partial [Candidatus Solibacter usitatus]|nr:SEC-C domain-containing protein [Candidatus Solibacter usitatus]